MLAGLWGSSGKVMHNDVLAITVGAVLLCATVGPAPAELAVRQTRVLFAVGVLVMHATIWAFLGLDYWVWVLTVAAVAVPTGWLALVRPAVVAATADGPEVGPRARRAGPAPEP